jgi:hypothetical protein
MPYKDPALRKQKHAEYSKKHYEANKSEVIENNRKRRITRKDAWRAFKRTLKCAICEENHPATLDFHHVKRSKSNKKVNKLVSDGQIRAAMKEIRDYCVVLCANCHRKGHHYEHYGIPTDSPNYAQFEDWFQHKKLDTP